MGSTREMQNTVGPNGRGYFAAGHVRRAAQRRLRYTLAQMPTTRRNP